MNFKDVVLGEIKNETAATLKLIQRLSDEHLAYKPHEKSMSLGRLAGHVIELHGWVNQGLNLVEFDLASDYKPFQPKTVTELTEHLEAALQKNAEVIESIEEEDWNSIWTMKHGEHIIMQLPKSAAFRYVIQNHLIHHRGQLTVYMRMLDIPLPGVYGPSADEQRA